MSWLLVGFSLFTHFTVNETFYFTY